jgi:hypothetical protein
VACRWVAENKGFEMLYLLEVWFVLLMIPGGLIGYVEVMEKIMTMIEKQREQARLELANDYATHFEPANSLQDGTFAENTSCSFSGQQH